MEILTIKVKNAQTRKLIEDLEAMDLIEVVKNTVAAKKGEKLSEKLAGSITAEQAESMQKELQQMRNEWNRNI